MLHWADLRLFIPIHEFYLIHLWSVIPKISYTSYHQAQIAKNWFEKHSEDFDKWYGQHVLSTKPTFAGHSREVYKILNLQIWIMNSYRYAISQHLSSCLQINSEIDAMSSCRNIARKIHNRVTHNVYMKLNKLKIFIMNNLTLLRKKG